MKFLILVAIFVLMGCKPQSQVDLEFLVPEDNSASSLVSEDGGYLFDNQTYARSCSEYLKSSVYAGEGDGLYWIDPDGTDSGEPEIKALCDMTRAGGGWTLVANRRGNNGNREDCATSSLNDFFTISCGLIEDMSFDNSYSIGPSSVRRNISQGEWRFIQITQDGTEDLDDAHIIHNDGSDLFPDSVGVVNKTLVNKVCDHNNQNCDETDVYFLWVGDGWWANTRCNAGYSTGTYKGNYGYCASGISTSSYSNRKFGDRNHYSETKLWRFGGTSRSYQEQIWTR